MNIDNLRTSVLRTLIPGFFGTTAPRWALDLLESGLGGYCVFAYNIVDPEQLAELTAQLRQVNPDVVVAVDEEGGDVTRLHSAAGSPYPGNAALGAVDDLALTASVHRAIGAELAGAGVTLDFAPAADVNVEDDNPVIGTRSFGRDPDLVARHVAAAVTGLQSAGVAACVKHFPGHGATSVDSHRDLPVVDVPLDLLRDRELTPFKAAVSAGVRVVMSGHIRIPTLTGDAPATLSAAAMVDLLRGELGFEGAVVTDAIEMRGVSGQIGIPEAVVRALAAGCDLICTGGETQKDGPMTALVDEIVDAVVAAVRDGRLPLSRLEDAAARGEALRNWHRQRRDVGDFEALGLAAARRAVHVDGVVPSLEDPFIVQIDAGVSIAVGGETKWGVAPLLAERLPLAQIRHATPDEVDAGAVLDAAGRRPILVVARDAHRRPETKAFVERLAASATPTVLVEMGWPAAWRPEGLAARVLSYGATAANSRAAAEVLLGGRSDGA
ncbi:MAG: glycoside hydrolase family 3 protein [Stackebrandtia sp.]